MAYSALILFFIAIWLVAFVLRAELRRALLLVSLVIAPLGPLSEFWFLRDYWARETLSGAYIGVEDVLFSFFLGGVTFAIYKVVFWATLSKKHPSFGYLPLYTAFITISFLLVLTNLLGVNSILSSSLGFIATPALIWYKRRDLIAPSFASGVLTVVLFVAAYTLVEFLFPGTLQTWCTGCNPTGLRLLGINVEELVWDFTWGLVGGVIFEATSGQCICTSGTLEGYANPTVSLLRTEPKSTVFKL